MKLWDISIMYYVCTYVFITINCTVNVLLYNYSFSMSTTLPPESSFPMQRVSTISMPPNLFSQPPDGHSAQVLPSGRKKSVTIPPLSPLQSPPPSMGFTGAPVEKVLCRPYRHASDTEIVDSFNNVELNNSHDHRISMPHFNESVPPPKPPRRASANPRIMEFSNDVVNGSRSNTASPELGGSGAVEEPPPIPVKKKNRQKIG